MCRKRFYVAAVAVAFVFAVAQCAWAVDGTWTSTATPGTWSTTGNWLSGTVASGADATADFSSQVDVPAGGITVNLDQNPVDVGNLIFGDTNTATAGGWLISDGGTGGTLQLDVSTGLVPNITVNTLGGSSVVQFNAALYTFSQGLNKLGSGTLVLTNPSSQLYGPFSVSAGTLQLAAGDNMLGSNASITVNGTLDLGGHSQTINGYITGGSTSAPTYAPGIVINGTVQNGTLIDASYQTLGSLFNFDARSGLVTANLGESSDPVTGGSVGLTKTTAGTLTLSGADTYTGGTIVNAGTLVFNTLSSIPATGSMTVNGGTLQFNTASLPLPAGSITLNAGGSLAVTGPYTTSNAWLGSGRIVNTSAGTLALVQDEVGTNMTTGPGYANLALGAVGTVRYTGTLTPMNNAYLLGGSGDLIISRTNALTNNGATPRSLQIVGGMVELPYSNSYTGGTTLAGGILKMGNVSSIGGPTTRLTFSGGELEINNSGLNIDNNNVNWTTFDGGFTIDPGVTFTINHSVSGPGSFGKDGGGTMIIGGTFNMDQGIALNYGTTTIAPGASLTAGLAFNVINGGGRGHVIIGQSGSSLPTTMTVTGGDATQYTGYMKLGGGSGGDLCTVDIYGNNTILQTTPGTGQNMISLSEWGTSTPPSPSTMPPP